MPEKVIVRQNNRFEIEFLVPHQEGDSGDLHKVSRIHALTPYEMMLASLGACTTIVLLTYAQNHNLDLNSVEIQLEYDRNFKEDSENQGNIDGYTEHIQESIAFSGDLTEVENEKLSKIAHQCSLSKMYREGIEIQSQVVSPS